MTETDERDQTAHPTEQISHALYGLIIITATLVAESDHVEEAGDALALLIGTAVVLLLAHTYSAFMATRATEGPLGVVGRRVLLLDNIPVLAAIVVPAALFALAGLDVMSLDRAYKGSIIFSLVALFLLGIYEARTASMTWVRAVLAGTLAGVMGGLVVFIEAFAE